MHAWRRDIDAAEAVRLRSVQKISKPKQTALNAMNTPSAFHQRAPDADGYGRDLTPQLNSIGILMMRASFLSRRFQCFFVQYRYAGFFPDINQTKSPKDIFATKP